MVDKITDHASRALGYLLSRYRDSTILRELVEFTGDEAQRFEDVAHDVLTKRLLDDAEGVTLDLYGKIVQVPRLDDTDAVYRRIIEAAITSGASNTNADTIAAVAAALTGKAVRYRWDGPMQLNLEYVTDAPLSADHAQRAGQLIDRAVGGGISWRLTEGVDGEAFRYDAGPGFGSGRLGRIVTGSHML